MSSLLLTLDDFDKMAKAAEALSCLRVTLKVRDGQDNILGRYAGYDQLALNIPALYDIRVMLESPAVKNAMVTPPDRRLNDIEPADLERMKQLLREQFGSRGWSHDPLSASHILDIQTLVDSRLSEKFEHVAGMPTSFIWEIEQKTADQELKEIQDYKWLAGLNRVHQSFADILEAHFGEAVEVDVDYSQPGTEDELHDILSELETAGDRLPRLKGNGLVFH